MRRHGCVAALVLGVLIPAATATAQTTAVSLYSESGHLQTYTPPADSFVNSTTSHTRSHFLLHVIQNGRLELTLRFLAPISRPLAPGVYEPAHSRRSEFGIWPEFDMNGACLGATGRFEVYEVVTNSAGVITNFAADFDYHCGARHLGAVRYNSARTSLVPFDGAYAGKLLRIEPARHGFVTAPGIDCGAGRLDCDEAYPPGGFTPVTLEATALPGYVFLGWVGACVGDTTAQIMIQRRHFCAPVFHPAPDPDGEEFPEEFGSAAFLSIASPPGAPSATVERRAFVPGVPGAGLGSRVAPTTDYRQTPAHVRFSIEEGAAGTALGVEFRIPNGSVLGPGRYDSPLASPTLFLSARDLFPDDCREGEFTIHEIEVDAVRERVVRFAADFSIVCARRPVTGSIRYRSTRRFLLPYGVAPVTERVLTVVPTLGGSVAADGIACGNAATDCAESFDTATSVTLEATSSAGYTFYGWAGDCADAVSTTTVVVDSRVRCYPVFAPAVGAASSADPAIGDGTVLIQELTSSGPITRTLWRGSLEANVARTEQFTVGIVSIAAGETRLTFRPSSFPGGQGNWLLLTDHEEEHPQPPGAGVLSLSGCERPLARLRVYEAAFVANRVFSLAVDFEARCQTPSGQPRHFVGAVRYQSGRSQLAPFDGAYPFHKLEVIASPGGIVRGTAIDCGPGRSACSLFFDGPFSRKLQAQPIPGYKFVGWAGACAGDSVTTISGEWLRRCEALFSPLVAAFAYVDRRGMLFYDSRIGEPVGQGLRQGWIQPRISTANSGRDVAQVAVTHPDGRVWFIRLQAPPGQSLVPGTYNNASDALRPASGPAMHIRSSDGACVGPVSGRFVIHTMIYFPDSGLSHFSADFEQRCTPGGPLLQGSIRHAGNGVGAIAPFTPATLEDLVETRAVGHHPAGASLFWRHRVSGDNALWQMNGVSASATSRLLPVSAGRVSDPLWEMRASTDMNGDGSADLIWQHAGTGRLAVWYLSGPTLLNSAYLSDAEGTPAESDLDWKIVAAGDTDLDGETDLVWRHRVSGAIRLWHMRGTRQWDSVDIGRVTDADWTIVGLSDVDDDGLLDLVWSHQRRGAIAAWFLWDTYLRSTATAAHTQPEPSWRLAGLADLDGDRHDDLVWHNGASGALGVWFMQGLTRVGARHLEPARIADLSWWLAAAR